MFNVFQKFRLEDGKIEVSIRQENPYCIITEAIDVASDTAEADLIAAVLEAFYQSHYQERARKEALEDVKAAAEAAKKQAEKAMPVLVNGNTLDTIMLSIFISDDTRLFPGTYSALLEYVSEIKVGQTYTNGQYVKVKDSKLSPDNPSGQYVLVRLNKGDNWEYDGTDILSVAQPYKNGFDIRRYEAYPRVKLGTATDTKVSK